MLMGRGLGFHGSCFGAEGQCDLHMAWNTQGHQTEPAPPWQVIPRILRGQIQVSGPVAGLQTGVAFPVAQPAYGALPQGCLARWTDFIRSGQSLAQLARGLAAALQRACRAIWDYYSTHSQIVALCGADASLCWRLSNLCVCQGSETFWC